mgnify:FL=1
MKCPYCERELPDSAKYCASCGKKLEKNEEKAEGSFLEERESDEDVSEVDKGESEVGKKMSFSTSSRKGGIGKIIYFLIIIVVIAGVYKSGIFSGMFSNKSNIVKKENKIENKNDKIHEKIQAHKNAEKQKENLLAYTDNEEMNFKACLSPEDYAVTYSSDGLFSFAYPKYIFNYSEVDEENSSYKLVFKGVEQRVELDVYTRINEGDAVSNAQNLYDELLSKVDKTYFKMRPTKVDSQGMARALVGGTASSTEDTGVYYIAVNDGSRDYMLEFYYPDSDEDDNYKEVNYVVDCIYRYCSFSGGTYQPRTYQQFLQDDMGTKK